MGKRAFAIYLEEFVKKYVEDKVFPDDSLIVGVGVDIMTEGKPLTIVLSSNEWPSQPKGSPIEVVSSLYEDKPSTQTGNPDDGLPK